MDMELHRKVPRKGHNHCANHTQVNQILMWFLGKKFNTQINFSMDECQTLCNRIAIQSNGEIYAIGNELELKTTFSLGFVINVQLTDEALIEEVVQVKAFVMASFEQAKLREDRGVSISV